ncbi:MAG: metal-sensitive transcriptional regulator [Proteobacteria bacterium]|jgi:CsoR family transcriptional regulator, copper-sensing transcriptional repressor|nr:metal-sensitive transcriptional regulator [Pseudomonadota bacterium]
MQQVFPNHEEQLARLARIEGQIRGIHKMIEDRRYCIDIASQIKAVQAALAKVQLGVLEKHVHHCVREAAESEDKALVEEKITEIVRVLGKMA